MLRQGNAAQLLVVLVGVPGSGKSTFSKALFSAHVNGLSGGQWSRISQDVLGSRGRCIKAARRALAAGDHVLIDRCNFDVAQRSHWLQLDVHPPPSHRVAVYLPVDPAEARRRVLSRGLHEGRVDSLSMSGDEIARIVARMYRSLQPPEPCEGFDEVLTVGADVSAQAAIDRLCWFTTERDEP